MPKKFTRCLPAMSNVAAAAAAIMAKRIGCPNGHDCSSNGDKQSIRAITLPVKNAKTPAPATFAPSIDMSYPSGWPRLRHLYNGDLTAMRKDILAPESINDDEIADTINSLRSCHNYTIDPHGAVAYDDSKEYRQRQCTQSGLRHRPPGQNNLIS